RCRHDVDDLRGVGQAVEPGREILQTFCRASVEQSAYVRGELLGDVLLADRILRTAAAVPDVARVTVAVGGPHGDPRRVTERGAFAFDLGIDRDLDARNER